MFSPPCEIDRSIMYLSPPIHSFKHMLFQVSSHLPVFTRHQTLVHGSSLPTIHFHVEAYTTLHLHLPVSLAISVFSFGRKPNLWETFYYFRVALIRCRIQSHDCTCRNVQRRWLKQPNFTIRITRQYIPLFDNPPKCKTEAEIYGTTN